MGTQIRGGLDGSGAPALAADTVALEGEVTLSVRLGGLVAYADHEVAVLLDRDGEQVVRLLDAANPLTGALDEARTLPHLFSILVEVGGEVVVEEYLDGQQAGDLEDVRSVTKGSRPSWSARPWRRATSTWAPPWARPSRRATWNLPGDHGPDAARVRRGAPLPPLGIAGTRWALFETGYALAGGFAFVPARGMVRIGRMVADGGRWEGEQVVESMSSTWFGYLWWESDLAGLDGYMTSGYGGQNILVIPSRDLVLVTSADAQVDGAAATQQQIDVWEALAGVVRALR